MLKKTQIRIMKFFVSNLTKRFSLRYMSKQINMHQALAYRESKDLIKNNFIIKDDDKYILNYKENHQYLAFIEFLRSNDFFENPKNKILKLFKDDLIKNFPYGYFIALIFGSAVNSLKPNDIDIMIIIEKTEEIETAEKVLYNISNNYTIKLHTIVLSFESVFEMLNSRDEKNVMNEVLDKHIIFYGAELYYKLITIGRK
jgi:hypothetical protein